MTIPPSLLKSHDGRETLGNSGHDARVSQD